MTRRVVPTRSGRGGFTLMELLAVIATIGILAAILLPSLARAREAARRASCLTGLSQIGMALHMYADEHDGAFPWSGGENDGECLVYFYPRYGLVPENSICPSDATVSEFDLSEDHPDFGSPVNGELNQFYSLRASYDYFGAYTDAPLLMPGPRQAIPRVPLMWDLGGPDESNFNHVPGGSNVLWMDGSVEFIHANRFASANLPYAPADLAYMRPPEPPPFKRNF